MRTFRTSASFIDSFAGRVFVLVRVPVVDHRPRRSVLIVPPFAEEMNKCRRQFTELSAALASKGVSTLLPDLFGTGDSDGEFADATWEIWRRDLDRVIEWARGQGFSPEGIVAARVGCVLAAEAAQASGLHLTRSVFWQPVLEGRRFLGQFLRLRTAAGLAVSGGEGVESLRKRLEGGETIEVAGYGLSPRMYADLQQLDLARVLDAVLGRLTVVEIVRAGAANAGTSVGSQAISEAAHRVGLASEVVRIVGAPFWASTEVVVNAALTDCTARLIAEG